MHSSGCLAACTVLAQRCGGYVKQLCLLVNAAWHVVKDVGEVREMCGVWCSKHHTTFERPLCKLERLKAEQLFHQISPTRFNIIYIVSTRCLRHGLARILPDFAWLCYQFRSPSPPFKRFPASAGAAFLWPFLHVRQERYRANSHVYQAGDSASPVRKVIAFRHTSCHASHAERLRDIGMDLT